MVTTKLTNAAKGKHFHNTQLDHIYNCFLTTFVETNATCFPLEGTPESSDCTELLESLEVNNKNGDIILILRSQQKKRQRQHGRWRVRSKTFPPLLLLLMHLKPIPSPDCPYPTWRSIASVPEDKEPSYAHKRIVKSKDISL